MDTSFLLDCLKYKIDINSYLTENFGENFELYITDKVLEELKKKKLYKFFKNLLYFKVLETNRKKADESLKEVAFSNKNFIVATNDKNLRKIFKKNKIKTLYIRELSKICSE